MGIMDTASLSAKVRSWLLRWPRPVQKEKWGKMTFEALMTGLETVVPGLDAGRGDLRQAEWALWQSVFDYLHQARYFSGGSLRIFITEWMRQFEVENLKMLARSLARGQKPEFLYRLAGNSRLQKEFITELNSLADLQVFLTGTPYYSSAVEAFPARVTEDSLFTFEMNLDNEYYRKLKGKIKALSAADKKVVSKTLLRKIEARRMLAFHRARFGYGFSPQGVLALFPNTFRLLSDDFYHDQAGETDPAAFLNRMAEAGLIMAGDGVPETRLFRATAGWAVRCLSEGPLGLSVFMGFMLLYECRVRDWTILLEAGALGGKAPSADDLLVWA